ncbi:MAG: hypothetical protein WAK12_07740 [Acidimicrobiales bacterium]
MIDATFGLVFNSFFGFGLIVMVFVWVLQIAALVSVASMSRVAFYQANSSKTGWVLILAVGLLVFPVGFFFASYYFLGVQQRVRRFDESARP